MTRPTDSGLASAEPLQLEGLGSGPGTPRAGAGVHRSRPTIGYLVGHPARWLALGFGSGLSPVAPGTAGTLLAWLAFALAPPAIGPAGWGAIILGSLLVGWWACARTAREMGLADPGAIVWDEVVAFWIVLWLVTPASFWAQLAAFALFRYFDAAKPGPVGWADNCLAHRTEPWARGWGILWDDLVAAACTLFVYAVGAALWDLW